MSTTPEPQLGELTRLMREFSEEPRRRMRSPRSRATRSAHTSSWWGLAAPPVRLAALAPAGYRPGVALEIADAGADAGAGADADATP